MVIKIRLNLRLTSAKIYIQQTVDDLRKEYNPEISIDSTSILDEYHDDLDKKYPQYLPDKSK